MLLLLRFHDSALNGEDGGDDHAQLPEAVSDAADEMESLVAAVHVQVCCWSF